MVAVRQLFRNEKTTEFVIATIPTVMAATESGRLLKALRAESVPVKRIVVNQTVPESAAAHCNFCALRRKDQMRAMALIAADPGLSSLQLLQAPLFDLEIRGVPALKAMGEVVWK